MECKILLSETENRGTPDKQHDLNIMYCLWYNDRTHFLRPSAWWRASKTGRVPCCWTPVPQPCTPCMPSDRPRQRLRCCTGNWCWWSSRCNGRAAAKAKPAKAVSWRCVRPHRRPASIRCDSPIARHYKPPTAAVPTWPTAPSCSWPRPARFAAPWWVLKIHARSDVFFWLTRFCTMLRAYVLLNNTKAWVFRIWDRSGRAQSLSRMPITLNSWSIANTQFASNLLVTGKCDCA